MYFLLTERKVGIWKNKIPYYERNSNLKIRFFAYVAKKLSALKKTRIIIFFGRVGIKVSFFIKIIIT